MPMVVKQILQYVLPALGFGVIALTFYLFKLLADRQKYAKQAENHVWIQIIPKAGKEKNYTRPIEIQEGIAKVVVPDSQGKISPTSPTHILGEAGEFLADYPANKVKFVQTTVSKLIYYEGDAEPLSNISDRPIVSAQLLTNLIDGVAASSAEAMRKSREASDGMKFKKGSGMMWLTIIVLVIGCICIITLVLAIQNSGVLEALKPLPELIRKAIGVK